MFALFLGFLLVLLSFLISSFKGSNTSAGNGAVKTKIKTLVKVIGSKKVKKEDIKELTGLLAKHIRGTGLVMIASGLVVISVTLCFVILLVVSVGSFTLNFEGVGSGNVVYASNYKDASNINDTQTIIGDNSSWLNSCQTMFDWYQTNIDTYLHNKQREGEYKKYSTRKYYDCNLLDNKGVADDCSAYVTACLIYAGYIPYQEGWTSHSFTYNDKYKKELEQYFNHYTPEDYGVSYTPRVGDIVAYDGHVEILANIDENGKCWAWSWGSVPDDATAKYISRAKDVKTYITKMWSNNKHTVTDIWQLK